MKIGILNIYSFPFGLAPTNRIIAYSKGIVEQGAECEIISIKPQLRVQKNLTLHGWINGAKYHHFLQIPCFKNRIFSSLTFRLGNIICYWRALYYAISREFDYIILSLDQPDLLFPIVYALSKSNAKLIAIADEYPTPIRKKLKSKIPTWKEKAYRIISKKLHGRILMTQKLSDFYNAICPKPSLLLSTITDTDRFLNISSKNSPSCPYLCYMGNMELSKDNVDNIIKAFGLISPKYPDLKLYLYGAPSESTAKVLSKLISELDLEGKVILKGTAQYNEVPGILSIAKILVASQPDTKRAEGGFPTKMGEYMMTGRPCVLTDVGEISQYVQHKVNGYLVPPDSPEDYAKALDYVLSHDDEATTVGQTAKEYILNNFSTTSAGEKIVSFLKSL